MSFRQIKKFDLFFSIKADAQEHHIQCLFCCLLIGDSNKKTDALGFCLHLFVFSCLYDRVILFSEEVNDVEQQTMLKEILKALDLHASDFRSQIAALDKKVEALDKKIEAIDKKIEAMNGEFRRKFVEIDKRIQEMDDRLEGRIDRLENEMNERFNIFPEKSPFL